jgi:hypothetical protein
MPVTTAVTDQARFSPSDGPMKPMLADATAVAEPEWRLLPRPAVPF